MTVSRVVFAMTDDGREETRNLLQNVSCTTCKYSHRNWCIKDNSFRLCSTCDHRAKRKNSKGYDCLCLQKPTKQELKTGKCKYYEEYKEE